MRNFYKFAGFIVILMVINLFATCSETDKLDNENDVEDNTKPQPPTPGLSYTLIHGPAYSVSVGTAADVHIVIPATYNDIPVKVIEENGFKDSQILSVTIPNSITSIGDYAFWRCIGLTKVTIPDSVTSISDSAFYGCTGLTSFSVHENNQNYSSQNGILYNKAKTTLILAPQGLSGSITIPNSVTSIGRGAFCNCTGLTNITIPNSVTSIGSSAFTGCTGLTSITIPNNVTSIEIFAFNGCTGLTSITIPNSVTSIGVRAFGGCTGLTSIIIGNSVTTIGGQAFDNCRSLTSITIPNSVTFIDFAPFYQCYTLRINIPFATLAEADSTWGGNYWRLSFEGESIWNNAGERLWQ